MADFSTLIIKQIKQELNQPQVFAFVMKHKNKMPRTALRYAIEKLPQELKLKAMAK